MSGGCPLPCNVAVSLRSGKSQLRQRKRKAAGCPTGSKADFQVYVISLRTNRPALSDHVGRCRSNPFPGILQTTYTNHCLLCVQHLQAVHQAKCRTLIWTVSPAVYPMQCWLDSRPFPRDYSAQTCLVLATVRAGLAPPQTMCRAAYFKSIRNARRMGALTGFAHGTAAAKDPHAQGTLRLQEGIIEYVNSSHPPHVCCLASPVVSSKAAICVISRESLQGHAARGAERCVPVHKHSQTESGRTSGVQCTAGERPAQEPLSWLSAALRYISDDSDNATQVDDCIAKYLWMQTMVQKMAERKKQGLPMPTSIAEVEEQLGTVPDCCATLHPLWLATQTVHSQQWINQLGVDGLHCLFS